MQGNIHRMIQVTQATSGTWCFVVETRDRFGNDVAVERAAYSVRLTGAAAREQGWPTVPTQVDASGMGVGIAVGARGAVRYRVPRQGAWQVAVRLLGGQGGLLEQRFGNEWRRGAASTEAESASVAAPGPAPAADVRRGYTTAATVPAAVPAAGSAARSVRWSGNVLPPRVQSVGVSGVDDAVEVRLAAMAARCAVLAPLWSTPSLTSSDTPTH